MTVYPASFQTASACGSAQKQQPRRDRMKANLVSLTSI
jgi:hypothetical protein